MKVTYDSDADAAYIYLVDEIGPGEVKQTRVADVELHRASINLDFTQEERIVGIEVLGASRILPLETLERADPA